MKPDLNACAVVEPMLIRCAGRVSGQDEVPYLALLVSATGIEHVILYTTMS